MDVDRYLARIGLATAPPRDVDGLETLQRAHLTAVPFENLDVFARRPVATGTNWSIPKIVDRGRGGWCFELNGAFAALLEALGFEVAVRGATVLTPGAGTDLGPTHATIEVTLERPYLTDVGFGVSFIRPLPLDSSGPHDGGSGAYSLDFDGDTVTLNELAAGGMAEPQYRFGRRQWEMADFDRASDSLQADRTLRWSRAPFATRLLDGGPDRVTLLADRLKVIRGGAVEETPVPQDQWASELERWFGMSS